MKGYLTFVDDFLFSLHHCEMKCFFSLNNCCSLSYSFFFFFNAILTSASVSLMIYPILLPLFLMWGISKASYFGKILLYKVRKKREKNISKYCLFCVIPAVTELGQNWTILSFFHFFKVTWSILFWHRTSNEHRHGNYLKKLHRVLFSFIAITSMQW